jgi:hypothetical protein
MTLPDEPRGWRMLQEMAQREPDPQKVAAIVEQMNCLLAAHERMTAGHDRRFYIAEPGEA